MLCDFLEPFTLLQARREPDGLGASVVAWADESSFRAALAPSMGSEIPLAGQSAARTGTVLLHDPDVTLALGDHVRREKDGAVYRIVGADMFTPACAALALAQAPVERTVIAP